MSVTPSSSIAQLTADEPAIVEAPNNDTTPPVVILSGYGYVHRALPTICTS